MADEWNDSDVGTPQPTFTLGKTFGGRGRGFAPAQEERRAGGGFRNKEGGGGFRGRQDEDGEDRGRNGFRSRRNEDGDGDGGGGRNGFRSRRNEDGDGDGDGGGGRNGFRSRRNDDDDSRPNGFGSRRNEDGERPRRNDHENGEGDEEVREKPKSTYIPPPPPETEEEIFSTGCSSGINFNKYEDIPVRVSGDGPPSPINSFEKSGLREYLLNVVEKCHYKRPTPIQKHSIPVIMAGRDLMACAQTGSGKTAAFLLPIINTLLEDKRDLVTDGGCIEPQVIIMSPTRELAIQIFNEARKFSHGSTLKTGIAYGGTAVGPQLGTLMRGCHIVVATPGRLNHFVEIEKIKFSSVRFLVLDEADRMLDMGFLPDMRKVIEHPTMTPGDDRQTLMFSATFPEEVQRLAGQFLNNYIFISVGIIGGACTDVEQKFYSVSKFDKRGKLVELLKEKGSAKTLVFVEQKRTADIIATFLSEKNFPTTSIHGDREQREREEALRDFKRGKMDILVATAVAARGLDISNVAHVVNFDIPKSIDEYVHRIGRTGRVGNRGLATSFYDEKEDQAIASDLVKILSQAQQEVPDYLKNASLGGYGGGGGGSSQFGGRDFRSNNGSAAAPPQETFEQEEW